ncbi:MAG: hypothetical protein JNK46_16485 [Methylobacteriaceae bacterium]|nr:hypothetical protein [Methylobacteriaceae bacterium]
MSAAFRLNNIASLFSEGVETGVEQTPAALRSAREQAFGENIFARARRILRAAAAMARPRRLVGAPAYLEILARDRAVGAAALPDPAAALSRPEGYCGAAADLAPTTLVQAYAQGLHARAPVGPATWWAPPARRIRPILPVAGLAPPARFDQDCTGIIARACDAAAARDPVEAATPALKHAHARLADRGFVHCWRTGPDCGGYGVAVGRVFILIGVFAPSGAAAQESLAALEAELGRRRFSLLDVTFCLSAFDDLSTLEMSRAEYGRMLDVNPDGDRAARWRPDAG